MSRSLVPAVGLLLVPALGCAHPVGTPLRAAVDRARVPDGLSVVFDDHGPMWGGRRFEVDAEGMFTVQHWRPGPRRSPEVWRGQVPKDALADLLNLLVRIEAWEQRVSGGEGRLDEGRATLVIRVRGAHSRIWEWANDLETQGRLVQVRDWFQALLRRNRVQP